MTPDLERVARSLFELDEYQGYNAETKATHWMLSKHRYESKARAAVAALIEISDDAIGAGEGLTDFILPHPMANTADMRRTEFRCGVKAMLRAVLGDEQEGGGR